MTEQELQARKAQRERDRIEVAQLLASPAGEVLLRHLEFRWAKGGLGATSEETAYRVGQEDAFKELARLRKEGTR